MSSCLTQPSFSCCWPVLSHKLASVQRRTGRCYVPQKPISSCKVERLVAQGVNRLASLRHSHSWFPATSIPASNALSFSTSCLTLASHGCRTRPCAPIGHFLSLIGSIPLRVPGHVADHDGRRTSQVACRAR